MKRLEVGLACRRQAVNARALGQAPGRRAIGVARIDFGVARIAVSDGRENKSSIGRPARVVIAVHGRGNARWRKRTDGRTKQARLAARVVGENKG